MHAIDPEAHDLKGVENAETYHYEFLHACTHQIGYGFCGIRCEPRQQFHVDMPVVKEVGKLEPLGIELLNRRCIPPVLIELSVSEESQLREGVRERLKEEEDHQHDHQDQGHL